jgi:hypothetical protein
LDGTPAYLLEMIAITETYENYPHVPFPYLYDGLRFVTMGSKK